MDTKQLKQRILDLAIRGKLVPQDPNDEPASVLLERIRAEKEQLIAQGKLKKSKTKASDKPHYENVPFEIPESWEWVMVQDIFELNPKNKVTDEITAGFIPMELVSAGFGFEHSYTTQEWGKIKKGYSHFQNGDIGIAKISPCFENRKSTIFYNLPNNIGAGTTELVVLRGHIVFTKFFLYLFQTAWYISEGTKYFKGVVGQQRVHKDIFTTLNIPLPPLAEQQRIVAEVEKWFALIDELEANKEDLKDYIKQVKSKVLDLAIHGKLVPQDPNDEPAIELLKRINPNFQPCDTSHYKNMPAGWTISTVGEVAQYINGRAFKPTEWEKEGIPIIRIQNLNDPSAPYNYSTVNYEDKYLIKDGDLLFAWAASLGAYIWKGSLSWLNQHIFKVEPKEFMNKQYLYYSFINLIADFYRQSHGSGMVHITKGNFESTPLLIPPLCEQKRINVTIENIFNILDSISAEL